MSFRAQRGIFGISGEGSEPLYRDEEEHQTQITRITQKNADSPSTQTDGTLARQGRPIEGFCGIGGGGLIGVSVVSGFPGRGILRYLRKLRPSASGVLKTSR